MIPAGDDDDNDIAARPEPSPAGYISPDPYDSDPGPWRQSETGLSGTRTAYLPNVRRRERLGL